MKTTEEYYNEILEEYLVNAKSWHDREAPYDSALYYACYLLQERDRKIDELRDRCKELDSALKAYKAVYR